MSWKRKAIRKLHPQQVLDCFIKIVLWIMETWALVRVLLILLLVLATMLMYAWENSPTAHDLRKRMDWHEESTCDYSGINVIDCSGR